jgi:hypothetical protein
VRLTSATLWLAPPVQVRPDPIRLRPPAPRAPQRRYHDQIPDHSNQTCCGLRSSFFTASGSAFHSSCKIKFWKGMSQRGILSLGSCWGFFLRYSFFHLAATTGLIFVWKYSFEYALGADNLRVLARLPVRFRTRMRPSPAASARLLWFLNQFLICCERTRDQYVVPPPTRDCLRSSSRPPALPRRFSALRRCQATLSAISQTTPLKSAA